MPKSFKCQISFFTNFGFTKKLVLAHLYTLFENFCKFFNFFRKRPKSKNQSRITLYLLHFKIYDIWKMEKLTLRCLSVVSFFFGPRCRKKALHHIIKANENRKVGLDPPPSGLNLNFLIKIKPKSRV